LELAVTRQPKLTEEWPRANGVWKTSHNKPALSVHLFKNVLTFPFIVNTFVRAKA